MRELAGFLLSWEKIRQNLIATAQDMPEEHYDTAPFEGVRSFRQQVGHVLHVADVLFDGLEKGRFDPATFNADLYSGRSKQEQLAALEARLRTHSAALESQPDSFWGEPRKSFDGSDKTAGELLQMVNEHELAHLNQLYMYLRARGIVPPTTRKKAAAKAAQKK